MFTWKNCPFYAMFFCTLFAVSTTNAMRSQDASSSSGSDTGSNSDIEAVVIAVDTDTQEARKNFFSAIYTGRVKQLQKSLKSDDKILFITCSINDPVNIKPFIPLIPLRPSSMLEQASAALERFASFLVRADLADLVHTEKTEKVDSSFESIAQTPLTLAVNRGHSNVIKFLFSQSNANPNANVDPNAQDGAGNFPLMLALKNKTWNETMRAAIIALLLNHGAVVTAEMLTCEAQAHAEDETESIRILDLLIACLFRNTLDPLKRASVLAGALKAIEAIHENPTESHESRLAYACKKIRFMRPVA